MSEWKPEVVQVGTVTPLENSDALSITQIYGEGGYPCIVKRDAFKPGDLAAYIPIDSVVDTTRPEFAFLAREGRASERISAKRLRGTFSMGLLVPAPDGMPAGADVAAHFGLRKYEPPAPGIQGGPSAGSMNEADPGLMPTYTDIEGLRRWPDVLTEGEEVVITEKIHGENFRAVHDGERLWVGSRTNIKADAPSSRWWMAARELGLANILKDAPMTAIYGEACGYTGGFPYGVPRGKAGLRAFDALDARSRRYFDYDDFSGLCLASGIPMAPVLYRGPWHPSLRELANGQSTIDPSHIREGIVIRPTKERWHPKLGRVILKIHGEAFLLKAGK